MQEIFREIKSTISFAKRANVDFPAHIHDDLELVYTIHGSGTASCNGKKYTLTDNSWFLVFPNQVHHYLDFVPGEYLVLIMKPSDLLWYQDNFINGVPDSALHAFTDGADDGIGCLLETAYREYTRDGFSKIIAAYLTAIFGKLLPFYPVQKAGHSQSNVLRILQYCSSHYKEDLTVESVAEHLCISRSCVSHSFSASISMNFCEYINSLRLQEAEELLKNRSYSVTEAAVLSGFPTIRTFNRAFLKKHGVSPSAYRKSLCE